MRIVSAAVLGFLSVLGVVAAAAGLPRLPGDIVMATSEDSPGPVTFRHENHLDLDAPDCTGCHPRLFRIVRDDARPAEPVTHEAMEAGRQCGACHDGENATGLDDCAHCHAE
jgi:c(7)-type cytochrome triheme protein